MPENPFKENCNLSATVNENWEIFYPSQDKFFFSVKLENRGI